MRHFFAVFRVDSKQFFSKATVIVLIVTMALSSYLTLKGTADYQEIMEDVKEFKKTESAMFDMLLNYMYYSLLGIRIKYVPSPAIIFFSPPHTIADLSAKIDTIMAMEIYNHVKGGSLFQGHFPGTMRFSLLVLLLGSFFTILSGVGLLCSREYLKFLTCLCPPQKLLPFLSISRFILITFSFLILLGLQLLILQLRGIALPKTDLKVLMI